LLLHENSRYRTTVIESLGAALSVAILNGRNDVVEILLAAGADVNRAVTDVGTGRAASIYGIETPLFAAIRWKNSNLVRRLLAAGAEVNRSLTWSHQLRSYGIGSITTTVLPAVVRWGDYPLIQDIINAGADVNAPEAVGGNTALFVAVEKGNQRPLNF